MPYDVELNQTREAATSRPCVPMRNSRPSGSLENADNFENRSADDSNDDDDDDDEDEDDDDDHLPIGPAMRRDQQREATGAINDELEPRDVRSRDDLYERLNNAWIGVDERLQGASGNSQDPERRINLCYRNLVDQYVTLVRRYFDVSRNRDTVSHALPN